MTPTRPKFDRVWHNYYTWEEVKHNMWGQVSDRASMLVWAVQFTGDHERYGSFMQRVIREWPISCENALTDYALNQRAWIGHAAAALANGCPEDITREAWGHLNDEQRALANGQADRAILEWARRYGARRGVRVDVEEPLLW